MPGRHPADARLAAARRLHEHEDQRGGHPSPRSHLRGAAHAVRRHPAGSSLRMTLLCLHDVMMLFIRPLLSTLVFSLDFEN